MANKVWDQTCRTCLATCGELLPIFSNDYYVRNLPDKLFNTTRIEVLQNDNLPKMMCKKCIFLVDSLYCFKDQCEMADIKLKKSLNSTIETDISEPKDVSSYDDVIYDSFNFDKAVDHSDAAISSEEEYHVEYASEEARLEVENARRQSRKAKNKHNKKSGVKVKSVEVVQTESDPLIYKNLDAGSPYKYDEIESINISDSDDRSFYATGESKRSMLSINAFNEQMYTTTERIQFFKNQKLNQLQDESDIMQSGLKRKIDDNSYNQLTKVPKRVMFKDTEEDLQYIEISDNQPERTKDTAKNEDVDGTILQINVIENSTGKVVQNYDFPINTESPEKDTSNIVKTTEFTKKLPNENTKLMETRMQNLIRQVILDIPEVCDICGKYYNSYQDVVKHKVCDHLNKVDEYFYCPVCHEKFISNSDLAMHVEKHKDLHSYICCICVSILHTDKIMRSHIQKHVNLIDIKCHICNRKFQRIQTLLNHCDTHLHAKELTCILCSEIFSNKEKLQKHINTVHKKPICIEFNCNICGVRLPESEREEHAKTHNTYPCPYCERSFAVKSNLRDHVYTHLGVQPYSCLVCEKKFDTQEERTQHMQEHMKPQQHQQHQQQQKSDRKKFRCRVCHEILVSRFAYGQHLKEKHWNAKQTNEILRELSESSLNEKMSETLPNDSNLT